MISSGDQKKNEHTLLSGEEKIDVQEKQSSPPSAIGEQVSTKGIAGNNQANSSENQHLKAMHGFQASNTSRRPPLPVPGSGVQAAEIDEVDSKPSKLLNNNEAIDEFGGMMEGKNEFLALKKANLARTPVASEVLTAEDIKDAEDIPTVEMNTSSNALENVLLYRGPYFYVRTTIRPEKRPQRDPLRKPSGDTAMVPKILPLQKERVADSETRLMPIISVQDLKPKNRLLFPDWAENVIVVFAIILSLIAHAVNMFNFPQYQMDEGTYMSAAWAVLNGNIYPYPYGYGHPPFAWFQLAGLVKLVGGFFLFGNAINTGRVLMLFYTLGSTLLIYLLMRKMSGSRSAALLALVLFSFSPLAIGYQRLVLLDNIATFWFLLSLYLLTISRSRLSLLALSAICFGLAMLSKEVLILFMPGMIYGVWLHATQFQRKFALVAFIYTFASVASLYLLLATLKGELFPPNHIIPGESAPHLSLIGTLIQQTARGQNQGRFVDSWYVWTNVDPLLMLLGLIAIPFNVVVGWWRRKQLFLAILTMSYWFLLIRGGVVFTFYLIPLIPMTAITIAFMINTIAGWMGKFVRFDLLRVALVVCVTLVVIGFDIRSPSSNQIYTDNQTQVQVEAMNWIRANVPRDSYVIMNSYLYMELRAPGGAAVGNGSVYPNAEVYINIATDPVLISEAGKNWDRVDYIIADSQMEAYIGDGTQLPTDALFMKQALEAAGPPCATFRTTGFEMHAYCVKHKNPRPVAMSSPNQQIMPANSRSLLA